MGFTYENLTELEDTRCFYNEVDREGSLFSGDPVYVPTVIVLSTATEETGIPVDWFSDEYLKALLLTGENDIRSDESAPRLLWGISPEDPNNITEYRFPTNIVRIRIIKPDTE